MTKSDTTRIEIVELLPFYVNNTLDGVERQRVEAALAADDALRAELQALVEMRQTWQSMPDPRSENSPGEAGLNRLLAEIGASEKSALPEVPVRANTNAPLLRRIAALAAAAAFGAIITASMLQDPAVPVGAEMVAGLADVPTLTVQFRDDVALADVSVVLRELGYTIVDGPSAIGLYRLAKFDGGALSEANAATLRARDGVFLLVEDPQ